MVTTEDEKEKKKNKSVVKFSIFFFSGFVVVCLFLRIPGMFVSGNQPKPGVRY